MVFSLRSNFIFLTLVVAWGVFLGGSARAETTTFFVDGSYDWEGRDRRTATMQYEGAYARWYVSNDYWDVIGPARQASLVSYIKDFSNEFDTVIYPQVRAVFGSEHTPGIDNDPKITVLLTRMIDEAGGYFREEDGFPGLRGETNQREMIYLNIIHTSERNRFRAFLAHEFQHLITFYQKTIQKGLQEEVWLNELRSEITPTLLGYDHPNLYQGSSLEARVTSFLDNPSDAILEWENQSKDYGSINLFGQYILDHYGRSVFAAMIQNDKIGIGSFNEALQTFGFEERFSDVFSNWTVTNLVNNCSLVLRELYCYKHASLGYDAVHVRFGPTEAVGQSVESQFPTKDWKAAWFEFERILTDERPDDDVFELQFSAPETSNFRMPYVVYRDDGTSIQDVKEMVIEKGTGTFYVEDFGFTVPKVVVIPSNQAHATGTTGSNAPSTTYSFTASLINGVPKSVMMSDIETSLMSDIITGSEPSFSDFPDGTVIRASGDYKVYIIKDGYKRWVQSAEIFDLYGHLNFEAVRVVSPEILALYKDSWLVRAAGDEKVYEINGDGTRHWLDMSPEDFTATGRLWGMVYAVNEEELNWYREGPSVK